MQQWLLATLTRRYVVYGQKLYIVFPLYIAITGYLLEISLDVLEVLISSKIGSLHIRSRFNQLQCWPAAFVCCFLIQHFTNSSLPSHYYSQPSLSQFSVIMFSWATAVHCGFLLYWLEAKACFLDLYSVFWCIYHCWTGSCELRHVRTRDNWCILRAAG